MKKLRYLDYYILVPYLILIAIGVVMVYSASAYWIQNQYGQAETSVMIRQIAFAVAGFMIAAFFYYFKLDVFTHPRAQKIMWIATFGLLIYLTVLSHFRPSAAVNGATAWIQLGPIHIQPTELAKMTVILYLAHMFSSRQKTLVDPDFTFKRLSQPLLMVGFCILLVFFQPDTGGAAIILGITVVMLAASGIKVIYGVSWAGLLAVLLGAGYWVLSNVSFPKSWQQSYQVRRLLAAVHPFAMRKLEGNQVVNSLVAIAHGGFFGVGLGNSSQKLGYLPEPYTDFILAVISEELGMVGALVVVGLIFFLILRFYLIGVRAKHTYQALIAYGIATMMLIQTVFNVGAVLGLIPVTGVTLPFISYGGSSLLVLSAAMGIMLNISAQQQRAKAKKEA
ncbi:FtsW/RodA/SpoVE family cell cycle protein [Lacticaseibacillus manihotivorans]|uniref:Probable peptidoglycan glycosyltransferase FtsW n=2 Tax=Lacticaseibacillus manihotivorans TaxID=88233 RepID=A0A0R1R961_9LACO|nr:putative peptidoglycan glycosyltransferase FtsW [Lacticaseibacillus manihotivorans]KRL53260.1 cell division protein [Lacticaseibacillus manihotivorans DSM 13343 = JCM 12514]QFQ91155.1 cell division protein FtsW [Lacticaseibacillus manihotivorans]